MWNIGFNTRVSSAGVNTGGVTDAGRVQGDNRRASLFGNDSYGSNNGYGQFPATDTPWWGGAFNRGATTLPGIGQVQHVVQSTDTNCFPTAKAMACRAVPGASVGTASEALPVNGNGSQGNNYIMAALNAGLPVVVGATYPGQGTTNPGPGGAGHCMTLQRDPQTGQINCFDPATGQQHKIAPVNIDANGIMTVQGYHNYRIVSALQYTDRRTQGLLMNANPSSMIG